MESIPDGSLDFAYIDGDHTLRGITLDLSLILPKIKEGGFIGGDDFTCTPWQHSTDYEPTLVFPFAVFFAEANKYPIAALGRNQYLIHKDTTGGFRFIDPLSNYQDTSLSRLRLR